MTRAANRRQIFAITVALLAASTLLSCGQPHDSSTLGQRQPAVVKPAPPAPAAGDFVDEDVALVEAPAAPSPRAAATAAPQAVERVEEAAPASDGRFVIERLDVDVPLKTFTPEGGVADPPTWDDAWLADVYGSPSDPDSGTSIVFLHSGIREPDAVGNRLLDRAAHASTLHTGDVLNVDGSEFIVSSTHVLSKDEVEAGAEEVWLNEDGRLVLITCLARPGEQKAVDVVVVVAQRSA